MMSKHDEERTRPDAEPRVAALSDMGDFQIADGYPDPRGWHVRASDGAEVGKVHDLIVDTGAMRTRYLDVRLDPDHLPMIEGMKNDERDVLIPIGAAQLTRDDDVVTLPAITPAQLATMPPFTHGRLTRDYENSVLATMPAAGAAAMGSVAGAAAADMASRDYYASEHFDDRRFWDRGARKDTEAAAKADADARATEARAEAKATEARAKADAAKARADADAERAKMAADRQRTLADQEVTVERQPVQSADTARTAVPAGETEVRIPLGDQEIIVRKRTAEPPPREHGTDRTAP
jgi:hypothetical protein